jgi:hypothetical protein
MGKQKDTFALRLKGAAMVKYSVECSICGGDWESDGNFGVGDEETELNEFTDSLYSDGWRYSVSKTYVHVGLHCPECHANRNKPE